MNKKSLFKKVLFFLLIIFFFFFFYFFTGKTKEAKEINWGINFSSKYAQELGLDWKENYLAILNDLKAKNIKIITHWDFLEPEKDRYFFDDIDWQIKEAKKRGAKIILVLGMKTGRWPECHIPFWAESLTEKEREKEALEVLKESILRYKEENSIVNWQIENEPFFLFGRCPKIKEEFLRKEIALVKSLDNERKIILTDSGEFSFWFKVAKLGDIVGTTLHRKAWFKELKIYVNYPFTPIFYWRKNQIIKKFFGKKVICVELQAEPWGPKLVYETEISEQRKTMDINQFKENIEFARKTGLDTFYLWGAEWWYWLKEKQGEPEIWQEAKKLFEI